MAKENIEATGMLNESKSLQNFPLEIIEGILSRLPAQSLLRFRCVERSWLSLISCPQFVRLHLEVSAQNSKSEHHRLLIYSCPTRMFSCSLDLKIGENHALKRIEFQGNFNGFWVVGSSGGLICVGIRRSELILWNPTTRKSWNLPDSCTAEDNEKPKYVYFYYTHGFVYDELNDDYKVVAFIDDCQFKQACKVYSSKSNSWKKIQNFPGCVPGERRLYGPCVVISGALHWMCDNINVTHYRSITSFNLFEETFGKMSLPDYEYNSTISLRGLCAFKDCLGLTIVDRYSGDWSVWGMKEYGVESSWSQLYFISLKNEIRSLFPPIIFAYSDGDLLLRGVSYFSLYNSRNNVFNDYKIHEYEAHQRIKNVIYLESLASLNFDS